MTVRVCVVLDDREEDPITLSPNSSRQLVGAQAAVYRRSAGGPDRFTCVTLLLRLDGCERSFLVVFICLFL